MPFERLRRCSLALPLGCPCIFGEVFLVLVLLLSFPRLPPLLSFLLLLRFAGGARILFGYFEWLFFFPRVSLLSSGRLEGVGKLPLPLLSKRWFVRRRFFSLLVEWALLHGIFGKAVEIGGGPRGGRHSFLWGLGLGFEGL